MMSPESAIISIDPDKESRSDVGPSLADIVRMKRTLKNVAEKVKLLSERLKRGEHDINELKTIVHLLDHELMEWENRLVEVVESVEAT